MLRRKIKDHNKPDTIRSSSSSLEMTKPEMEERGNLYLYVGPPSQATHVVQDTRAERDTPSPFAHDFNANSQPSPSNSPPMMEPHFEPTTFAGDLPPRHQRIFEAPVQRRVRGHNGRWVAKKVNVDDDLDANSVRKAAFYDSTDTSSVAGQASDDEDESEKLGLDPWTRIISSNKIKGWSGGGTNIDSARRRIDAAELNAQARHSIDTSLRCLLVLVVWLSRDTMITPSSSILFSPVLVSYSNLKPFLLLFQIVCNILGFRVSVGSRHSATLPLSTTSAEPNPSDCVLLLVW